MCNINKGLCLVCVLIVSFTVNAQRMAQTINDGWKFTLCEDIVSAPDLNTDDWATVSLPHTWNAEDAEDEIAGYHRGKGWYRKSVLIECLCPQQRVYLHFEGANQVARLYVNGRYVGEHEGGYAAFNFDISDYVEMGKYNCLAVSVDNSYNPDIPPLSADYTFFGGIYRNVYLVYTSPVQISMSHYASNGVYLRTSGITDRKAEIGITTYLCNASDKPEDVMLETEIIDAEGKVISLSSEKVRVDDNAINLAVNTSLDIDNPQKWSIDNPYLYRVISRVRNNGGAVIDEIINPLGIREFEFDVNSGFRLNGNHVKLMGTSRHQDYAGLGNALRDEMHIRDVNLIKGMGGNMLRIAHYPQAPSVVQTCDNIGLVTFMEIPIVNAITVSDKFMRNCIIQAREMVYQNYNSPSIVAWAYMNEVLLRPPYDESQKEERTLYMSFLNKIATAIEQELRSIDPDRYTMLPCHSNFKIYQEAGIAGLPRLLGFNLYNGWYNEDMEKFEHTLDKIHKEFPETPLLLTEYGADSDVRLHSFSPQRFDFSCEFSNMFHEHYLPEILKRDYIAGAMIWNLNDFYSEARKYARPNINSKGVVTTDRERKDSYHIYKTYLSEGPEIHIASKGWKTRSGASDNGVTCCQPVTIYTNLGNVNVFHNGALLGEYKVKGNKAVVKVPFVNGDNVIEAVGHKNGKECRDYYTCRFECVNVKHNFHAMNVMLGSDRYFEDRTAEICWIPEQRYSKGSWGYVGGERMKLKTKYGAVPASDLDIIGTSQDPVFQTQRVGLKEFRADIPDGLYAVYLYLAELNSDTEKKTLVYNLGDDILREDYVPRTFSIDINGKYIARRINLAEEYGTEKAIIKKVFVTVSNGKGLSVRFHPVESHPVLNAIRIVKVY